MSEQALASASQPSAAEEHIEYEKSAHVRFRQAWVLLIDANSIFDDMVKNQNKALRDVPYASIFEDRLEFVYNIFRNLLLLKNQQVRDGVDTYPPNVHFGDCFICSEKLHPRTSIKTECSYIVHTTCLVSHIFRCSDVEVSCPVCQEKIISDHLLGDENGFCRPKVIDQALLIDSPASNRADADGVIDEIISNVRLLFFSSSEALRWARVFDCPNRGQELDIALRFFSARNEEMFFKNVVEICLKTLESYANRY